MKKLFFATAFLLLSLSSYAQTNLDSLMGIWNDKTKADTIRLEAMEIFLHGGPDREFRGNDLIETNPDSVLILIEQMLTLAKGYPRYELLAVRIKGGYYQHNGVVYHQKKKLVEADSLYNRALAMAHAMKDRRLIILSTITLANGQNALAISNGQPDSLLLVQAQKNFVEALNLIELTSFNSDEVTPAPDRQLNNFIITAQCGLAFSSLQQGNLPSAIELYQKALARAEEIGSNEDTYCAFMIGILYYFQSDYPNARKYLEKSLQTNNVSDLGERGLQEGAMGVLTSMLQQERNYPAAIQYLTKFLKIAEKHEDKHWIAHILGGFGDLYLKIKDFPKAEDYLNRALISMNEAGAAHEGDQLGILEGLHKCYIELKDYKKAIKNDSLALLLAQDSTMFAPYARLGLSMLAEDYYEQGDYTKALQFGFHTIKKDKELGPSPLIKAETISGIMSRNSLLIGKTYNKQGQFAKAITWCEKAKLEKDIELQKDACECLYEAHKALKHGNEALAYHEEFLVLSDSLHKEEISENLQQMEFGKQLLADSLVQAEEKRKVEVAHQEQIREEKIRKNTFMYGGFGILVLAGGLWSRLRYIRKSKATLQIEKDKTENLLLNILPAEIAEELKANGRAEARDFDRVSILFTDFKEFTQTSEKLTAQELVGEINFCFEAFDNICGKYKIEKIKTIGDAYMAAGGLPVPTDDSVKNTVLAALEMQQFISERKANHDSLGKPAFKMRLGIHTGPVVAGIVGVKKFQYDIWGDTVNTASRMESNSEVGKVNISQSTYEAIKEEANFTFQKREKIQVKGKGEMEMYFVSNEKIS